MQQPGQLNPARRTAVSMLAVAVVLTLIGCSPPPRSRAEAARPHEGVALKLRCADPAFAAAITPRIRVWSAKTGAQVEVIAAAPAPGDGTDLAVIPPAEIGFWADRGELRAVPIALREMGHPYQWQTVLPAYRGEQLAGWGNQLVALPLAGDGFVIVYRADRFNDLPTAYLYETLTGRELAPPATWEDFAAIARFFAVEFDGKPGQPHPSLPPFPTDPVRAADLFQRIASCYDRPAIGEAEQATAKDNGDLRDPLSFQFHIDTARPRLGAPSFQAAAGWLSGLRTLSVLPPPGGDEDPVAALVENRAVMAVLRLDELARLPRDRGQVPTRFGIAAMPGTRSYLSAKGDAMLGADNNYIPYFAGGRFGVVKTTCPHPDVAFDLLADLGSPSQSLELLATPGLGVGPFRTTHADHPIVWLSYAFDQEGTKALRAALGKYVRVEVRNRTYGVRSPDQRALTQALGQDVVAIVNGGVPPHEAMNRVIAAWDKISSEYSPDRLLQIRRRGVGLN